MTGPLGRWPRRLAARTADRVADALAWRLAERVPAPVPGPDSSASAPAGPPPAEPEVGPESPYVHLDREGTDNFHFELLMGWLLRPNSNCIDIGANEGRFLAHIVNRAPNGTHFAWEPLPDMAAALRPQFPQVTIHQAALANETGQSEFVYVPELPGYSGLRERAYPKEVHPQRITVDIERLDDELPPDYVPDLIKIDVEGGERGVIEGGLQTICRSRPIIVLEHGPGSAERYGTTPENIWDLLVGEAGLHLYDLDAVGPLSREQLSELFASGRRWNYVALP